MNNVVTQIVDRVSQLNPTNLETVHSILHDSITGLRCEVKAKMDALNAAGHESPEFTTLMADAADLAQTVEVLVKAAGDVTKLNTTASKTLDRVQKRLARYRK